jgi:acetylornithine deacetylase/succinyl-diaminopimelate desuccinylase-like protein
MAFLAALHAFKQSGRTLPVNLVLVAEGEEEIASPNFPTVVANPEWPPRSPGQSAYSFPPPRKTREATP